MLLVLAQSCSGGYATACSPPRSDRALDEARAGLAQAQLLADAADRRATADAASALVDGIAASWPTGPATRRSTRSLAASARPANSGSGVPEFGSDQVDRHERARDAARRRPRDPAPGLDLHRITYADGRQPVPGFAVGTPLNAARGGPYELYYLFPLTQEETRSRLVKRTLAVAGIALVLLLGCIAWLVTRQVVSPVRMAAADRRAVLRRAAPGADGGAGRGRPRQARRRPSTRWPRTSSSRSTSSRTCRGCSGGSSPTSRTSCGRR